jgi:hypothetical protein
MRLTNPVNLNLTAILPLLLLGCVAGGVPASPTANVVPLVTTLKDGVADSQVVPIRFEDGDAWLALDTGAPFTFLFSDPDGPEYVEDAGTITIGSEERRVPGFRDEAIGVEMFRGVPIVGVLGLDFFLDAPAEIDYPGGRLVRHRGGRQPACGAALPAVPLRGRGHGRALVDVELDGIERTLMLDTGAHDTILIGAAGEDDDEPAQVQTADGRIWDVRIGSAVLSFPGEEPRSVPVMRAADLPYIAPELREIEAHGLLGLTSLGWRRVVFDFDAGVLRLGPLGGGPAPARN